MSAKINIQEILAISEQQSVFKISPFPTSKSEILIHIDGNLVSFNDYSLNPETYSVILSDTAKTKVHINSIVSFATIVNTPDIVEDENEDNNSNITIYKGGFVNSQIRAKTITHENIKNGTINAKNINVTDPTYGMVTRLIPGPGIKITSQAGSPTGAGVCIIESIAGVQIDEVSTALDELRLNFIYLRDDIYGLTNNITNNNVTFNGTKTFNNQITFNNKIILNNGLIFANQKEDGQFYNGTASPTNSTLLNYDGFFRATKVYNAVFNDIAECMPSDGTLQPGDFAMVDPNYPTFRLTRYVHTIENMAYFMGIISVEPGFIVGENPAYEHPVYLILKGMVDIPFSKLSESFDIDQFKIGDDLMIARDRSYVKHIGKIIEINHEKQTIKVFV